jgi:hypothetical protein
MIGYLWRARWRPVGGTFSLGGGYTVMVMDATTGSGMRRCLSRSRSAASASID